MTGDTALERFLKARSDSSLQEGVGRASERAGVTTCHQLADALDAALREMAAGVPQPGVAVVAVGGYGRREQCRHSDIDVMLLVEGGAEAETEAVSRVLYPLWDASLKVGHSVRTVGQAIETARQNLETFTALLNARLVAGDRELFERFLRARRRLVRRRRRWLRGALAEQYRRRVARERWQPQEPELKEGRGGLRQLHTLRWLDLAEAIAAGREPPPLPTQIEEARETLLATRNALHAQDERPNDRYRQDLSGAVTNWLQVDRTEWGRRLLATMRTVDAAVAARVGAREQRHRSLLRWGARRRSDSDRGAAAEDASDLDRLLAVLRREEPLGLDPLPPAAWLDRVLPEWEVLRCLPHTAPFHRHPVDVHSLRTVEEVRHAMRVDEEGTATPAAAAALPDKDELLLAALLHDIGKGHEGDHPTLGAVIAERFASRAGLAADTAHRLATVAAQHLLLPTVATRRDIADDRVIRETADLVGDAHTLHLLYLVSVADARATGPDVWSPWKAQLMHSLYRRVLDVLSEGAPEAATAARLRGEATVEALTGVAPAEEVTGHLRQLPPAYVLSTPPETIGEHLALIRKAAGGTAVRHDRLNGLDRLTVVTADRPGILSLVAGTLAAHNANVLGGVAYTRDDGVAMQVMHVSDALGHGIDDRRWQRILEAVPQALAGEFPVDERLAETRKTYRAAPRTRIPTTVHIDNAASERYSIVEVSAADRIGLLYAITRVLHELSLDIHLAKVDTIGPEVFDAFYVLRRNGRRVERADEIERITRRVKQAVASLDDIAEPGAEVGATLS